MTLLPCYTRKQKLDRKHSNAQIPLCGVKGDFRTFEKIRICFDKEQILVDALVN